ncbi:MAG TPA: hypothetical protein PLH60_10805 [Proteiniphilum sp.]|nr:hypothetical protein [Proteiniphilum sp.]HPD86738.1 hypothetical protein [Proteiniphilum sp.]HPJ50709.1 hypothetical protein [Proteiniphilum sp.]HPR21022.1 hypothetical protein [Proteiniphilum sp.]
MKKEEFKQKTHQVIDELAETISRLEARAGEIADDAKEEYKEQLEKLRELRDSLSAKLDEYDMMADGKWDVVKESAGNFFASVAEAWKENYGKVADAFRKEPPQEN